MASFTSNSIQDTVAADREALFEASRRWQMINEKLAEASRLREEQRRQEETIHNAQLQHESLRNQLENNAFDVQSMMEQTAFDLKKSLNGRSVIKIVGLPPVLSPSDIHQFLTNKFIGFGEIKNIVFDCLCDGSDKDYTVTALVQFASDESAANAVTSCEVIKYNSITLDISYAF
jgi:flagella basal body P-ring formation protein FlgA